MTDRLQQLKQFLLQSPGEPFLLFAIAKELENIDEYKAITAYLELKNLHPDYVGLYYHLGKLYEKKQDFENAIAIYDAGIHSARTQNDRHAQSELMAAKADLTGDDFD